MTRIAKGMAKVTADEEYWNIPSLTGPYSNLFDRIGIQMDGHVF